MTEQKKIVFSHPTGNQNARAALAALYNHGLLSRFYTSIAVFPNTLLDGVGNLPPLTEINRRRYDKQLQPFTKTFPFYETGRLLSTKFHFEKLLQYETGLFSVDAVYRALDKKVASSLPAGKRKGVTGIYAYEDGALFSFQEAKRLGLQCLYDLPIGYWRASHKLLETEKEIWPHWASTITGLKNSQAKLQRKDEELGLAERIFVASSFTAKTLEEYPGSLAPLTVIPYGFPPTFEGRDYGGIKTRKSIKVLFVGSLSQRKGIANLFAAVEPLRHFIELTIVGNKVTNDCPALDKALAKHRWIPSLSHENVLKLMREQDVFVFPSLFEGFGLVITEAMSQGTPVITTERTAGPDLIEHGKEGWIVKAGDTQELSELFQELVSNPILLQQAGFAATEKARLRSWEVYGRELAKSIQELST